MSDCAGAAGPVIGPLATVLAREKRAVALRVALENLRAEGCDCRRCNGLCALCVVEGAIEAEREACARVAEEHLDHVDTHPNQRAITQDHVEPPYRCNVAQAIRGRK